MLCIFLQWREEMDFYLTGCQRRFRIGCKRRREFGYSYVPGVLTFQTEDGVEFHILRFFSVRIVSDLYDDLKQTSEYKPPQRATEIPRDGRDLEGYPFHGTVWHFLRCWLFNYRFLWLFFFIIRLRWSTEYLKKCHWNTLIHWKS